MSFAYQDDFLRNGVGFNTENVARPRDKGTKPEADSTKTHNKSCELKYPNTTNERQTAKRKE